MAEKTYPSRWTQDDFEAMSWHDNTIHGLRIRDPHEGWDFDLIFDIDYILEWIPTPEGHFEFVVAPATLTFHDVDKLRIDVSLDFKEHFSIDRIERQEITNQAERAAGMQRFLWTIVTTHSIYVHENPISFEATGFTQELTKAPIGSTRMGLEDEDR